MKFRSVYKVFSPVHPHWVGDGFRVNPVFADYAFTEEISPMLMFDYAEPKHFPARPGKSPLGVGRHPHRGMETVTVAFQGQVEHHDSTGGGGLLKEGDVQWMTAGRGIVHQEHHSKELTETGGTFEMCQLWVNLPKKDKMTKPRYQHIAKQQIPVVALPLNSEKEEDLVGTARIIAGELGTTKGAASTFSPVQMWDLHFPKKDSVVELPFPADHNCLVFVRRGAIQIIGHESSTQDQQSVYREHNLGVKNVALMRLDGSDLLQFRIQEPDTSVLIMGGEPLNEPIAAHGPFVMNTEEEIMQAFSDYRLGKMGN